MDAESLGGVSRYFVDLNDPRVVGQGDHLLIDIVMIALVALLGGGGKRVGGERHQDKRKSAPQRALEGRKRGRE